MLNRTIWEKRISQNVEPSTCDKIPTLPWQQRWPAAQIVLKYLSFNEKKKKWKEKATYRSPIAKQVEAGVSDNENETKNMYAHIRRMKKGVVLFWSAHLAVHPLAVPVLWTTYFIRAFSKWYHLEQDLFSCSQRPSKAFWAHNNRLQRLRWRLHCTDLGRLTQITNDTYWKNTPLCDEKKNPRVLGKNHGRVLFVRL